MAQGVTPACEQRRAAIQSGSKQKIEATHRDYDRRIASGGNASSEAARLQQEKQ